MNFGSGGGEGLQRVVRRHTLRWQSPLPSGSNAMPNEPFFSRFEPSAPTNDHSSESESSGRGASVDTNEVTERIEPGTSDLLDAVLRETIGRISDDEAHEMITTWLAGQQRGNELSLPLVESFVGYLLERRFRGWYLPAAQQSQLALWLWEDPLARSRIERVWNAETQS